MKIINKYLKFPKGTAYLLILVFISCSQGEVKKVSIQGETMGTYYKITSFTDKDSNKMKEDVEKFLKLFNDIFSTYIKESEISKINQTSFDKIKISDPMNKALSIAIEVAKKSDGYFDPTIGPLVNAWGFGPDGKRKKPTKEEIETLLKKTGFENLEIKKKWLHLYTKGIYLDLSAIAKGFGVDELVKHLEYGGHRNFLVEIGGEVRTRGQKADGSQWRLGIEGPSDKMGGKLAKVIPLKNMSLATSGSYRNFIKYGDEVFQHTIDPKSGFPAKHKTLSVSVLHEYCADADAWATALMSMGSEKGLDIANKNNLMVLFQVKTNEGVKLLSTSSFDKYIKSAQGK